MATDQHSLPLDPWSLVDQFETSLRRDPATNLEDYLPPPAHPQRVGVLVELVRLDLEFAARRGVVLDPTYYLDRFPELANHSTSWEQIVFEAYRWHKPSDQTLTAEEYAARFGVNCAQWPAELGSAQRVLETRRIQRQVTPVSLRHDAFIRQPLQPVVPQNERPPSDLSQTPKPPRMDSVEPTFVIGKSVQSQPNRDQPTSISGLSGHLPRSSAPSGSKTHPESQGQATFPEIGERFLNFQLVGLLGQGSFGRVYRAEQTDLANRHVALKVGYGLFSESHTLAQLQHTNIMPIYSRHQVGQLQALCMPYFGSFTLYHWILELQRDVVRPSTGEEIARRIQSRTLPTRSSAQVEDGVPTSVLGAPCQPFRPPELSELQPEGDEVLSEKKLANWTMWKQLSYCDLVAWVGCQLAAGLTHAHERGIIHRDIKPANVLITDDGIPMLLDFNIAQDAKQGRPENIGGTLPYMAPEQLDVYITESGTFNEQVDVYALGVVLYELLAGERPFPDRHAPDEEEMIRLLRADRGEAAPDVRSKNAAVPGGLAAIIAKSMAPSPARRYRSTEELREDLQRHLNSQPLRFAREPSYRERVQKWFRRNAWARSTGTIATAAILAMLVSAITILAVRQRSLEMESRLTYEEHLAEFRQFQHQLDDRTLSLAKADEGLALGSHLLGRYGLSLEQPRIDDWKKSFPGLYLPSESQSRVQENLGEVYYLLAKLAMQRADLATDQVVKAAEYQRAVRWNQAAQNLDGNNIRRAILVQYQELLQRTGRANQAEAIAEQLRNQEPSSARDQYLLGYWYYQQGRHRNALKEVVASTQTDPSQFSAWFLRGLIHLQLDQNDQAVAAFSAAIALRSDFLPAWLNRTQALIRQQKWELAAMDADQVLRREPGHVDALILRGGICQARGQLHEAEAAYTQALNQIHCPTRVYFYRAAVRDLLKDEHGAKTDRSEGLKQTPSDEWSWIARAELSLEQPLQALTDVEEALKLNAASYQAYQLKAHLLAERLQRVPEAIAALDQAIHYSPDSASAWAGRGVLYARLGERAKAHRDAEAALTRGSDAANLFQVGCIFALSAKSEASDKFRAIELLRSALRQGFGREYLHEDQDLEPIRNSPEFAQLLKEFSAAAKP